MNATRPSLLIVCELERLLSPPPTTTSLPFLSTSRSSYITFVATGGTQVFRAVSLLSNFHTQHQSQSHSQASSASFFRSSKLSTTMPRRNAARNITASSATPHTPSPSLAPQNFPPSTVLELRRQWKWAAFSQFFFTFAPLFNMDDVSIVVSVLTWWTTPKTRCISLHRVLVVVIRIAHINVSNPS